MTWKDIILAVIVSAGRIGSIILLTVKFSANIIADHLEKKYTLKIDKELENINHLWKIKFILVKQSLTQNLVYIVNYQGLILIWSKASQLRFLMVLLHIQQIKNNEKNMSIIYMSRHKNLRS